MLPVVSQQAGITVSQHSRHSERGKEAGLGRGWEVRLGASVYVCVGGGGALPGTKR